MRISALTICSLVAIGVLGPVFGAQITDNELVRRQQWEADAREARSYQLFATCVDDDPEIAIAACTRQILTRGNRSAFASGVLGQSEEDPRDTARIIFMDSVRHLLRANAYSSRGEIRRALRDYDEAARLAVSAGVLIRDEIYWIHERRAEAYYFAGDRDEALESYEAAIEINPVSANVMHYRTLELAAAYEEEFRDPAQAFVYAQRLNELFLGLPDYVAALAIAYAANSEFDQAVTEQQRAMILVTEGDQRIMDAYQRRLDLFTEGKTVRIAPRITYLDVRSIRLLDVEASDFFDLEASE